MSTVRLEVTDFNGKSIDANCDIVYPVRKGSTMTLKRAKVLDIVARPTGQGGAMDVFANILTSNGRRSKFRSFKRCSVV